MKTFALSSNCTDCLAHPDSIFSHLSPDQLDEMDLDKCCNYYKRGTVLYHEGSRINGIYCVASGIVKVFKTGTEGKEQIIRFAKKGDILGYRSVIRKESACTSTIINEDAHLCYISAELLLRFVSQNPAFAMEITTMACKELGEANNFITEIAQKTVRERMAEIIIYLKNEFGVDEDNTLRISLTREEIANIIGTATESGIRLLSEFKNDKLIELKGRRIKIINEAILRKTANLS
jgi:CRP/FNR family transcriptional regulator, polysaccharide utilization system transcription regulator